MRHGQEDIARAESAATRRVSHELLARIDACWRAANYLTVGQIYLLTNPLLRHELRHEQIKPRLLGHWGTSPGLSFVYAHLNRIIVERDLNMIFVTGPGHGGPAVVAHTWLEGSYSECCPDVPRNAAGMEKLFRQFSFPGGIPSHAAPEVPGSIHEGGELGYSLTHAYGAAFDNPDLVVACVIGDGEAETGALAASWHSNKFLNPCTDGAVLPILHLNGYKIANPTVLARIPPEELDALLRGCGYRPHYVEGEDPQVVHELMANACDRIFDEIGDIQRAARRQSSTAWAHWPVLVLRTPKGWTGPREIDGRKVEGHWRSHQVPIAGFAPGSGHLEQLEQWLRSYRADELFAADGAPRAELAAVTPMGRRRMGSNAHANGGLLLEDLRLPEPAAFALDVGAPGSTPGQATRVLGAYLRDVFRLNARTRNFRLFGPDETESNRLQEVFAATDRTWLARADAHDEHLGPEGRVMEVLSEHLCQGWLEGYLLSGRHGLFSCYEAFVHIVDSMFNQHAKWLKSCRDVPWRAPIASLNILLTSHVWRQDHNGFSHQDPGFLDVVANKGDLVRVYLAPDANTLLWVADRCLRSRNLVNVMVAGKQEQPQWFDAEAARRHCEAGVGILGWAGTEQGGEFDVVLACAGDVPTIETLAAVDLLRRNLPGLRMRVVNVVNLMTLQPPEEHPDGLAAREFDALFGTDRPVIFAFHGYPWLIHRLAYRRTNHPHLHVRGYKERGTTTTPFDMVVLNDLDRFHLAIDVIDRVPGLRERADGLRSQLLDKLAEHRRYIRIYGQDLPEVREWRWH
ncbi:MAG TPA: phosphoketolase family protein [Steroidobacteraceae bacterium]|nr:phosphoketolase family protein [Steroidobacteraceae bacterium]